MGWFSKRAESREREERMQAEERERAEAAAKDPLAPAKRRFADAAGRGGLDEASAVLDGYLADHAEDGGKAEYEAQPSLLERAAPVRRALRAGDLDTAAALLEAWELRPPDTTDMGPGRLAELPNLNTAGMLLIDYFACAGVESHPRFDELMDTQLRNVAKWARLSSPQPRPGGFFDRAYAETKSKREMWRAARRKAEAENAGEGV